MRRWVLVALAVAVALAVVAVLTGGGSATASPASPPVVAAGNAQSGTPVQHVVIAPGDTLWTVARPYVPEGESLQAYVAEVIALNEIDPSALQPGSVLDLPLPDHPGVADTGR